MYSQTFKEFCAMSAVQFISIVAFLALLFFGSIAIHYLYVCWKKKIKVSFKSFGCVVLGWFLIAKKTLPIFVHKAKGKVKRLAITVLSFRAARAANKDLRDYRKAVKRVLRSKNDRIVIEVDREIIDHHKTLSKHDLERLAIQQSLALEAYMAIYGQKLYEAIAFEWSIPRSSDKIKTKGDFEVVGRKVVKRKRKK